MLLKYKYILFGIIAFCCSLIAKAQLQKPDSSLANLFAQVQAMHPNAKISKTPIVLNSDSFDWLFEECKMKTEQIRFFKKEIRKKYHNPKEFNTVLVGKTRLYADSLLMDMNKYMPITVKISNPIFIKEYVFIIVEEYCGDTCGSGIIYLYKKTKNGYREICGRMIWIS